MSIADLLFDKFLADHVALFYGRGWDGDRCAIAAGERLPKIPGLEVKRLKLEEIDRGDGYVAYAGQIEAAAMARSLRWAFTCGVRSDGMTDIVRLKLIE